MSLIQLRNICKHYVLGEGTVPILKNISLDIEAGEMVALMGTSGSGKSTLMNILGCLDRPSSGEYLFDKINVSAASNDQRANLRNSKIGFVFQNFNLLGRTTALENVIMPLSYRSEQLDPITENEMGINMLKRVGLEHRMRHTPSQLSGGQQQRVAIARALINNPPVIFADEPTGNLDSRTSDEILEMFKSLNEEGITVILVTHEADVAEHAKRIIRLKDGQVEGSAV